jgi:hypothetical protein
MYSSDIADDLINTYKQGSNMTKFIFTAYSTVLCALISTSAFAVPMSKTDYVASKSAITSSYKSEKDACDQSSGNAKDICMAVASGNVTIATAQLEENYAPSDKNSFGLKMAKIETTYAVAKETCDDKSGVAAKTCMIEAKSVYLASKADAKPAAKMRKMMNANEKVTYEAAKKKCESLDKKAKTNCINTVKTQYELHYAQ